MAWLLGAPGPGDGELVTAIAENPQGGVYVTGQYMSGATFGSQTLAGRHTDTAPPTSVFDMFAAAVSAEGTWTWTKGTNHEIADSPVSSIWPAGLDVDSEGRLVVAGRYSGAGIKLADALPWEGGGDLFVARLDPNNVNGGDWVSQAVADAEFNRTEKLYGDLQVTDIKLDHLDNVYVTGRFKHGLQFSPAMHVDTATAASNNNFDMFVAKFSGETWEWAKSAGHAEGEDAGVSFDVSDSTVALAANCSGAGTNFSVWTKALPPTACFFRLW